MRTWGHYTRGTFTTGRTCGFWMILANEKGMVLGTKTDVSSGEWLASVGLDA